MLSTVPSDDWVLLGSGKFTKSSRIMAAFDCSLSARHTLIFAGIACTRNINVISNRSQNNVQFGRRSLSAERAASASAWERAGSW